MRKFLLLLLLLLSAKEAHAQFKLDSADYVRQYGINSHWKNPFTVVPDSQFVSWGYNAGGPGSVAKFTLLKTDTLKFFWATAPISAWSIWSCNSVWSKGINKSQCNSFVRSATVATIVHDTVKVLQIDTLKIVLPATFIHDTFITVHDTTKFIHDTIIVHDTVTVKVIGSAQWVYPRDTVRMAFDNTTCGGEHASIDSVSGLMNIGCNDKTGKPVKLQMCMVSILSDSSVVWAAQSKLVCPDSVPRKRYGTRWQPNLWQDTTLVFELVSAVWH